MPIASKRKVEARKEAPVIEAEPIEQPLPEQAPPTPKVTALVFSYDSAPALRRCLAALEGSNDRASIEILVVDCGSHDESAQLDSAFSSVTMLARPPAIICPSGRPKWKSCPPPFPRSSRIWSLSRKPSRSAPSWWTPERSRP